MDKITLYVEYQGVPNIKSCQMLEYKMKTRERMFSHPHIHVSECWAVFFVWEG